MCNPGTLSAALAYVPNLWQETTDPKALGSLLAGWARECGWRACGFAWVGEGVEVFRTVEGGAVVEGSAPPEVPDALRRIRAGEATASYTVGGAALRVFAGVQPPGRALGLVWAERAGQPWSDEDRAYLALVGKTMERAPAVTAVIGPVIDPDRLYMRLGDAAVIAGRMAHDFDNILTGIIGFSDLTLPLIPAGSQATNFVAEIAKVGQRGITFTQQLHQLSRSGQVKPHPAAVAVAVAKEETRLKAAHPAVRFEKDVQPALPAVAVEAGPLETVIGHLMENAAEASPPGGVVRVAAHRVDLPDSDARGYLGRAAGGEYVHVTVTDAGAGIKPEVRRRLFVEPFYTTKVRHRGLGLAIAYRILCAHRGGIQIEPVPVPGTGTQVRVVLPLAPARPPAAAGNPAGAAVPPGNTSATAVGG